MEIPMDDDDEHDRGLKKSHNHLKRVMTIVKSVVRSTLTTKSFPQPKSTWILIAARTDRHSNELEGVYDPFDSE